MRSLPARRSTSSTSSSSWRAEMTPAVTILLATYQGERFLQAQLDSLVAQEGVRLRVMASDDGSHDSTLAILKHFAAQHDIFAAQHDGPQDGASANFLSLLALVPPDTGLLAFCDQDDLWLPGKMARAARMLQGTMRPTLWLGRVSLCDEALEHCRPAPLRRVVPTFGGVLSEALGPGHAMVLNAPAWALLHAAAQAGEAQGVPFHDWWATQMVLGAGGQVLLDDRPTTLYRQHQAQAIGSGHGFSQWLRAPSRMLGGTYAQDARAQRAALRRSAHRLTPEARDTLDALDALPSLRPLARLRALNAAGLRREGAAAQAGLLLLAASGRL